MLGNISSSALPESASFGPGAGAPPVDVGLDPENTIRVNPSTGAVHVAQDDGSVVISFDGGKDGDPDTDFDANLAEHMDSSELSMIAEDILRGIEEDERSRKEWEDTFSRGIDLLGLKLEEPSSDVSAQGSVSKVYHPLLIEAVVRYQANAGAELLPSTGPVKVRDDEPGADPARVELAEAFEKDFNHYLTVVRKEYYPDFRRLLFAQGLCGNGFKKVYRCPLRKAPVSDYVAAKDLIVSNDAVSLTNATRVTHRTTMRQAVMKRLQLGSYYRKCDLSTPSSQPTSLDEKIGAVEGVNKRTTVPADYLYTVYECYAELDIAAHAHKNEDDEETGLPLPYRITVEKDSRTVLEIRRNWREGDEDYNTRQRFVKYGYIPGLGFYDYGLVHLLGQTARALTAIERQLIDAGQFSNFPGLLLSDVGGRQRTTQIRVPPGGANVIKTGGLPIGQVVMSLPYKEPSGTLVNIAKGIEENGRRLGSTAEVQVGEGRADVPVGTTIAMIEQSTKITAAVHKQNHESQLQEFLLLKELFEEDPEALWKFARTPARKWQQSQEISDIELVPASDPNTPSHIHRVMKATALAQLVQADPSGYNVRAVRSILITTLGYSPAALLAPPQPPGAQSPHADPAKMAKVQLDAQKIQQKDKSDQINAQLKLKQIEADTQNNEAERENRLSIQKLKTTTVLAQQQNQQKSDQVKQARDNLHSLVEQHADHVHGLRAKAQDHVHGLERGQVEHAQGLRAQQQDHMQGLGEQARQHAHEKSLAELKNSMVSSSDS